MRRITDVRCEGLDIIDTDVGVRDFSQVLSLGWSVRITSEGASCLGRLTALQDLDLRACETMPDVGMAHLTLLTSLTRLNLSWLHGHIK